MTRLEEVELKVLVDLLGRVVGGQRPLAVDE